MSDVFLIFKMQELIILFITEILHFCLS